MEKNQVAVVTTSPAAQEGVNTEEGGDWKQANYVGNSPRQSHDPYSKTYKPGLKNHPNFGWKNQQDQGQDYRCHNPSNNAAYQHSTQRPYQNQNGQSQHSNPNPPPPSEDRLSKIEVLLEGICKEVEDSRVFREEVRSNMQNQDAAINKLVTHISYLFKQVPSHIGNNTSVNSRVECQAIILRSGKALKETTKEPQEKDMDGEGRGQEEIQAPAPNSHQEEEVLKPYAPKAPYPQQLKKSEDDNQFSRFLEVFKRLQINIPFAEAIEQMPLYAKFLKELMTKKRSWRSKETVVLTEECSPIIQHKLPQKLKDPGSFQIPCIRGEITVEKALCDLGASINLISLTMMRRIWIEEAKPTRMALQLADISFKFPYGVVEDLLVNVGDFIFLADFVVLDMEEEAKASIILGWPFLATAGAIIDIQKGELTLRLHDAKMVFHVFKAMSYPLESLGECMRLDLVEALVQETFEEEEL
ncbi:uncharacterized protein LOC130962872 [Arachis stenosperma]|uniref:uncharacterized protein LOC130962872 n=1 Tax=Arachis stenosperma TaxID=217475 RepID=UPI0025AD7D58|nr:uncharacterized protein LOC130962872 [Arachis stenosperma]